MPKHEQKRIHENTRFDTYQIQRRAPVDGFLEFP